MRKTLSGICICGILLISLSTYTFSTNLSCRRVITPQSLTSVEKEIVSIIPVGHDIYLKVDRTEVESLLKTGQLYPGIFIEGKGYKALPLDEFSFLVENINQIKRLIEEWKKQQNSPLPEFILSNISSGFLKMEDLHFDGQVLSFKLGGAIETEINVSENRILKLQGLVLLPSFEYFREQTSEMRQLYENILMDGEANMGLDHALLEKEMYKEVSQEIKFLPETSIRLQRHGEELPFWLKLLAEQPISPGVTERINEEQWIGRFTPLDSPDSVFSLMNSLYYSTFGATAFGVVDKQNTLEPGTAKRSAEDFYHLLQQLDIQGELPETITVEEWGAGDGCSAAEFLSRIKELDEENQTDYFSRIQYVLIDYSSAVVDSLKQAPHLAPYREHITVIQADVLDQETVEQFQAPLLIRANLLLNSLPMKLFEIKEGILYEIEMRPYLDMEEGETIQGYSLAELKNAILNGDIQLLRTLGKPFFNRIKFVERAVRVDDISSSPYAEYIQHLLSSGYEGRFTLDVGAARCLSNMLSHLSPSGVVQIADAGYLEVEGLPQTATLRRYFGAVYHPVNMHFLSYIFPNVEINAISQYKYAGEYAPKIIPIDNLFSVLSNFSEFKKYFNSNTIGAPGRLRTLSQKLMDQYGFCADGIQAFVQEAGELRSVSIFPRIMIEWLQKADLITSQESEFLYWHEIRNTVSGFSEAERINRAQEIYNNILARVRSLRGKNSHIEIENYEDLLVYILYRIVNDHYLQIREQQKYLTPEYGDTGSFQHLLHILGARNALNAIWNDLASFYPGVKIFIIRNSR